MGGARVARGGAAHGFALAKALASSGEIGEIWAVPRPLVYRALGVLEARGLVRRVPYGTFHIDMNTHLDLERPGQDARAGFRPQVCVRQR